jgi:hypothetical protein
MQAMRAEITAMRAEMTALATQCLALQTQIDAMHTQLQCIKGVQLAIHRNSNSNSYLIVCRMCMTISCFFTFNDRDLTHQNNENKYVHHITAHYIC